MTASAYILAAVVAFLLVALVLCWMQPRRKAKASTLTIDIECDSTQAMARIAEVTAAVERLDAAQRKAGLNLSPSQVAEAMRKSPEYVGKLNTNPPPTYTRSQKRAGQVPPKRLPSSPGPAKKQRSR